MGTDFNLIQFSRRVNLSGREREHRRAGGSGQATDYRTWPRAVPNPDDRVSARLIGFAPRMSGRVKK